MLTVGMESSVSLQKNIRESTIPVKAGCIPKDCGFFMQFLIFIRALVTDEAGNVRPL